MQDSMFGESTRSKRRRVRIRRACLKQSTVDEDDTILSRAERICSAVKSLSAEREEGTKRSGRAVLSSDEVVRCLESEIDMDEYVGFVHYIPRVVNVVAASHAPTAHARGWSLLPPLPERSRFELISSARRSSRG